MRLLKPLLAVCLFSLSLAGCQSNRTVVDYDTTADFSRFTHYQWLAADGGTDEVADPLLTERIQTALQRQLAGANLLAADDAHPANLLVRYYLTTAIDEQEPASSASIGLGGGNRGVGLGVSIRLPLGEPRILKRVQIIVDFVDAADQQLKWRGLHRITLSDDSPNRNTALIDAAIADIIAAYPPR